MEELGSNQFEAINNPVRKKRSYTFRRPRPDSQPAQDTNDISSLSSTPSDDASKVSSDENLGGENRSSRKEINLNLCNPRFPPAGPDGEKISKRSKKEDVSLEVIYGNTSGFRESNEQARGNKRSSEGVLAPANWKSSRRAKENAESQKFMDLNSSKKSGESYSLGPSGVSNDGLGNESKVKKVKLKVGGVTRTIDANASSSSRTSQSLESNVPRGRLIHKDGSDDDPPQNEKRSGLQGIPWKDFSKGGFALGKEDTLMGRSLSKNRPGKQGGEKSDQVRKSRRVPKKHVLDGSFDDDDEDDEIRYLEKLKNSKLSAGSRDDDDDELAKKDRRSSKLSGEAVDGNASSRSGKEGKRKSPYEDTDYEEEEEPLSDGEAEGRRKKKPRKESVDSVGEPKREMALTTRQRALQGKDTSGPGGSLVEFPNGLPPAPSRKQKEKLSDVELQLKKAEAAQRRKLQNEKAARESEAEAIRKILGQDSNRKKREEKKKKRQEELAQEKAADALIRASNTVRWIMGPNGITVVFPKEMGLPSLFDSKPSSYPPPREKCAGPSCTNPYRYRDSKSKLPLCSLQCYRAVQEINLNNDNMQPETNLQPGPAGDAVSAH